MEYDNYFIYEDYFIFKPEFNEPIDEYIGIIKTCKKLIFLDYYELDPNIKIIYKNIKKDGKFHSSFFNQLLNPP